MHATQIRLKSSPAWLARQFRDPYVKKRFSQPDAFRSRAAFKLVEINAQHKNFLEAKHVRTVIDLGAAPGGWSQVVAGKMGWVEEKPMRKPRPRTTIGFGLREDAKLDRYGSWSSAPEAEEDLLVGDFDPEEERVEGKGTIIAVDLLPIVPIPGVQTIRMDFLSPQAREIIQGLLISEDNPEGKADIILSDMAANASGNKTRDSAASLDICEAVFSFASENLRTSREIGYTRGGTLLLKHFSHPLLLEFRKNKLEPSFHNVKYIKPDSSRSESSEGYWLCSGWKGLPT